MTLRILATAAALVAAFLAGTLVPSGSTAPRQGKYLKVEFMQVKPGRGPEYRRLERNLWQPIHQARVDKGYILSWAVYGHHFPGASQEYQYAVVTEYPSFEQLEDSKYPELFAEVEGREDYEEILQQTNEVRTLVRQDLWVLLEHTN